MKTGLIVFIVGLIISISGGAGILSSEGLTNGIVTLFLGYPLIVIGVVIIIYKLIIRKKQI